MKKRSKQPLRQLLQARRRLRDSFAKHQEKMAPLLALTEVLDRKKRPVLASLLPPEERLKEEDRIREEQYWKEVADALRAGDVKKIREAIQTFGVWALTKPPVLAVLDDLVFDLDENDSAKRDRAKRLLLKICPPLAALDSGRRAGLTANLAGARARQKRYRNKRQEAEDALMQKLEQIRKQISLKKELRGEKRKAALSDACSRILADALNDPDPHMKAAARKLKKEYGFQLET